MATETKIPKVVKSSTGPALVQRLKGEKPNPGRAAAGATVAGAATGVLVYRFLRQ
jgi:hypothetical protein